jgi:hypothetical protein
MRRLALSAVLLAFGTLAGAAQKVSVDLSPVLARLGEYVTAYYARAESIICEETVRLQPVAHDLMSSDGAVPRRLLFDLRVSWAPSADGGVPEAQVLRTLISVNNRAPREKDHDACMDPKAISPEPLSMFLPESQGDYIFTAAGRAKVDGRPALMIDYKSREQGPISTTRKDDCFSIELPGRTRGRVWVDETTAEVLRLDEHLAGMFDVDLPPDPKRRWEMPSTVVVERLDSSIVYKPVSFTEPDEVVLLPSSKDTLTVVRNSGTPRLRTSQTFRNYRRFITGARIVQ